MPRVRTTLLRKCRRRRSLTHALTLIELLVSSVLAAMLMLALVGLLRTTHAQSRASVRLLGMHPPTAILADQIRRDLVNARHIEVLPDQVRLQGYMAQEWRTRRPTYRPAEVTYAVVAGRRGTSLVRQETQFSEFAGKRSRLEVLWSGAAALEVVRFDEGDEELESDQRSVSPPGMTPMPAHFLVSIYNADGQILLSEDIFHHHAVP